MLKITESWGSVRKIRFKYELYEYLKYAALFNGKKFDLEDIVKIIKKSRIKQEQLRLSILQTGHNLKILYNIENTSYFSLAKDMVSFLKGIKLVDINETVHTPQNIIKIYNKHKNNYEELDKYLLQIILKSKYKAYLYFLINLQENKYKFLIPKNYSKRTKKSGLSNYLKEHGFFTDIASFYTIRDLLYQFNLINWYIDKDGNETIYMTSKVDVKNTSNIKYKNSLDVNNYKLLYNKKIDIHIFSNILINNYLKITKDKFSVVIELIPLRDLVTIQLEISDITFNEYINNLKNIDSNVSIELSQGIIISKPHTGLLIKILNSPKIGDEIYATYLRISRRFRH